MNRSEFEARVDAALGSVLAAHGFGLVPQTPATIHDAQPTAIYEADVETFQRGLPQLATGVDLDVACVDLTVQWVDSALAVDLEGFDLAELLDKAGVPRPGNSGPLDAQLAAVADALARALPAFRD